MVMVGCLENESCSKILNFLERLEDRMRCTHEETVAVVKPWEAIAFYTWLLFPWGTHVHCHTHTHTTHTTHTHTQMYTHTHTHTHTHYTHTTHTRKHTRTPTQSLIQGQPLWAKTARKKTTFKEGIKILVFRFAKK